MKSIDIIRAWKDMRQADSMAPCVSHAAALRRGALWRCALLFALSVLALGACAGDESMPEVGEVAQHSYISAGDAWSSGSIPVCWDTGGFATEKGWVRSSVEGMFENRWEFYIDFTGWGQCAPNWFGYAPGIRISINDEGPHTGGLGSSINGDVGGMVLNFTFNNWSTDACSTGAVGEAGRRACIELSAAHEFGHALALAHEANREDSACALTQGPDGDTHVGDFDNSSLMSYCNPLWANHGQLSAGDIIGLARLYGGPGDVFVARSQVDRFGQEGKRHDYFCVNDNVCLTGDFNGDGADDLVAFTRGPFGSASSGDVFVSLSDGDYFYTAAKWHDAFAFNSEVPKVGDFNGDGRDDIAAFGRSTNGDVFVALSNGSSFGYGYKWHEAFSFGNEVPEIGDFNGDGRDDIASFMRGPFSSASSGDVFVALSSGSSFGYGYKWHEAFSFNSEVPKVGDFNGDGKDDIASFMRGPFGSASSGDVFVALSNGSSFGYGYKWHEAFSFVDEVPEIGDLDGDGRDDAFTFARGGMGKVFVALSEGYQFGYGALRKTGFCLGADICAVGDVSGEGLDDVIAFKRR